MGAHPEAAPMRARRRPAPVVQAHITKHDPWTPPCRSCNLPLLKGETVCLRCKAEVAR